MIMGKTFICTYTVSYNAQPKLTISVMNEGVEFLTYTANNLIRVTLAFYVHYNTLEHVVY